MSILRLCLMASIISLQSHTVTRSHSHTVTHSHRQSHTQSHSQASYNYSKAKLATFGTIVLGNGPESKAGAKSRQRQRPRHRHRQGIKTETIRAGHGRQGNIAGSTTGAIPGTAWVRKSMKAGSCQQSGAAHS